MLSGAGTAREDEERAALAAFCPGADLHLSVLGLPDGRLPAHWDEVKDDTGGRFAGGSNRTWSSRRSGRMRIRTIA